MENSNNESEIKDQDIIKQPSVKYIGTHADIMKIVERSLNNSSNHSEKLSSGIKRNGYEEFWDHIVEPSLFDFVKDMKEQYYFSGFLDVLDHYNVNNIFKKYTLLHEAENHQNDDNLSDYDEHFTSSNI